MTTTTTKALLKKESPLRAIWPKGEAPIKSPIIVKGKGREGEVLDLYEVDLNSCSQGQVDKILEKMEEILNKKVDREEFFKEGFRIRLNHTNGFSMSMGNFI